MFLRKRAGKGIVKVSATAHQFVAKATNIYGEVLNTPE